MPAEPCTPAPLATRRSSISAPSEEGGSRPNEIAGVSRCFIKTRTKRNGGLARQDTRERSFVGLSWVMHFSGKTVAPKSSGQGAQRYRDAVIRDLASLRDLVRCRPKHQAGSCISGMTGVRPFLRRDERSTRWRQVHKCAPGNHSSTTSTALHARKRSQTSNPSREPSSLVLPSMVQKTAPGPGASGSTMMPVCTKSFLLVP